MNDDAGGVSALSAGLVPKVWARKDQLQYASTWGGLMCAMYPNTDRRADLQPLYDQAALDAALNLWPRDCRLCANFTTQVGGCVSVVQCVDSMQFKTTPPRQHWVSAPNVANEAGQTALPLPATPTTRPAV